MTPETLIPATALRLIGAFYCFGSIIGARMVTRYSFIDHAIEAISGKKQPAAEKLRETIMIAGLLPVFAGGLALMLLSPFRAVALRAGRDLAGDLSRLVRAALSRPPR